MHKSDNEHLLMVVKTDGWLAAASSNAVQCINLRPPLRDKQHMDVIKRRQQQDGEDRGTVLAAAH
jgi:hypothetical protein